MRRILIFLLLLCSSLGFAQNLPYNYNPLPDELKGADVWAHYDYLNSESLIRDNSGYVSRWRSIAPNATGYATAYQSDFSAGVDGWAYSNSLFSNQSTISDGVTTINNCLKFYANASNTVHGIQKTLISAYSIYILTFNIYIPNSQTNINGYYITKDQSGEFAIISQKCTKIIDGQSIGTVLLNGSQRYGINGYWCRVEIVFTILNGTYIQIFGCKNATLSFIGANSSTDDIIYINDVKLQILTGNHLVQPTLANQPQWLADGVKFDGSSDYLRTAVSTLAQPITIISCLKQNTWTANDVFWDGLGSSNMYIIQSQATPNVRMYAGSFNNEISSLNINQHSIIKAIYNGAQSNIGINKSRIIFGDIGTLSPNGLSIGATSINTNYSDITVKEVIIFTRILSYEEINKIELYLQRKYQIPF